MPDMNGLDASCELRKMEKTTGSKVQKLVAITGDITNTIFYEVSNAGFDAFALLVLRVFICACASLLRLLIYANFVLFTAPVPTKSAEILADDVIVSCLVANAVVVAVDVM
jgi:hypothetical protein